MMRFGNFPKEFSDRKRSKIAILPVPYDKTSTWLKGADKGPEAILKASSVLEGYDIETDSEVYKKGISAEEPIVEKGLPEIMTKRVKEKVLGLLNHDKFVVVVGGEHSVSIGAVQAHAEKYNNISVLQLDAHTDLRDEYFGSTHNHGCVMARIKEVCPAVQVGIRSMDSSELAGLDRRRVFFAEKIYRKKDWMQDVVNLLSDKVYITIDLDVFDPSIMPSTGTPEPGGLLWYDVLNLLRKVAEEKNVVGFDVVELCPGENKSPDFMVAKLVYKLLSYRFK